MMNTLVLDMSQNPDGVASGYDMEKMPIPVEAAFVGESSVRVWVVNLRGTKTDLQSAVRQRDASFQQWQQARRADKGGKQI